MWAPYFSAEDDSVNFVRNFGRGKLECRYVRRTPDCVIVYLSSHSGCKHACRFCHLTATGQTSFEPAGIADFVEQAGLVLRYYADLCDLQRTQPAQRVKFNWMARGEALSNPDFIANCDCVINQLTELAELYRLEPTFGVSTILPHAALHDHSLYQLIGQVPIIFYYSLYSVKPTFRKRWLPQALSVEDGLRQLENWQAATNNEVVLHWPFIAGENDSAADVQELCNTLRRSKLYARFNMVHYNPPNSKSQESEPAILERNFAIIRDALGHIGSQIVPRVGFDVKASCGMFME